MFGYEFQFEQISFWLGFVAATLLWWLVSSLRTNFPRIKAFIVQQREIDKQRRLAGLDAQIREKVLQRAQKMHLAAALFPLDDLLVIPTLVAPPIPTDPENLNVTRPIISEIIPYAPQWPELSSQLSGPALSFPEALLNKSDIAIIGQPGSGKTVALAYLASLVARRASAAPIISTATPFLIHAIDLRAEFDDKLDPLEVLTKTVSRDYPILIQRQLPAFLKNIVADGNALLLLDGLDELSPEEMVPVTNYLKGLKQAHPSLHLVVAAAPENLDGLTGIQITPLALSTWNNSQLREFIDHWGMVWGKYISPTVQKQTNQTFPHPFVLNSFLLSGNVSFLTPLEWTARIWALYAGDLQGPQISHSLEALTRRLLGNMMLPEAFSALANLIITNRKVAIPYGEAEKFLSKFRLPVASESAPLAASQASSQSGALLAPEAAVEPQADQTSGKPKTAKGQKLTSSGGQILSALLNAGLLTEYTDGSIAFTNPLFTGYFASLTDGQTTTPEWPQGAAWSAQLIQCQFLTAQGKTNALIADLMDNDSAPLYTNIQMIARWLKDAPANSDSRSYVMRRLVQYMQSNDLPFPVRIFMMSAAAITNDPAVSSLARQFLGSKSKEMRQLAAIGCGMTQDSKAVDDLISLFADNEPSVQYAACYALTSIDTPPAWEAIQSALQYGDEGLRLVVGEAMANHSSAGHSLLKEAVSSDDILVRRAAVFGIAQIHDPWATGLLEKIAVEDGQWVVRNAAGQALEDRKKPGLYSPGNLVPAHESPWLLSFASKQGVGLSPNQATTPMLLSALQNGSVEQKIAALDYLKYIPDEGIIKEIYNAAYSPEPRLQDAGLYTLWFILSGGHSLPSPTKFGY